VGEFFFRANWAVDRRADLKIFPRIGAKHKMSKEQEINNNYLVKKKFQEELIKDSRNFFNTCSWTQSFKILKLNKQIL
jgi:hypothetical protein